MQTQEKDVLQQNVFKTHSSSVDSLDSLLPQIHAQSEEKKALLIKECNIKKYLKTLGLEFKTDPLEKQQKFYDNLSIKIVKESMSPLTPQSNKQSPKKNIQKVQQQPYSINQNPLKARRSLQ